MNSIPTALLYARMAAFQLGLKVEDYKMPTFSDDPAVNLRRAAVLLESEADVLDRGKHA